MINAFKMEADMFQLLPLQREEYTHKNLKGYSDRMTFHPSVESVLNSLIPNVVCGFVYGALVESYASEHNSRMMAMQTLPIVQSRCCMIWKLNTTVCVRQRSPRKLLRSLQVPSTEE